MAIRGQKAYGMILSCGSIDMHRKKINYNIIFKIIEIGRTEEFPDTFNPKNNWWLSALYFNDVEGWRDLSIEAHVNYYKGIVLTEKASDRFMGSS